MLDEHGLHIRAGVDHAHRHAVTAECDQVRPDVRRGRDPQSGHRDQDQSRAERHPARPPHRYPLGEQTAACREPGDHHDRDQDDGVGETQPVALLWQLGEDHRKEEPLQCEGHRIRPSWRPGAGPIQRCIRSRTSAQPNGSVLPRPDHAGVRTCRMRCSARDMITRGSRLDNESGHGYVKPPGTCGTLEGAGRTGPGCTGRGSGRVSTTERADTRRQAVTLAPLETVKLPVVESNPRGHQAGERCREPGCGDCHWDVQRLKYWLRGRSLWRRRRGRRSGQAAGRSDAGVAVAARDAIVRNRGPQRAGIADACR